MKPLITVLVLAGACAGIFALGSIRQGANDKPFLNVADELPITVKVASPRRRPITRIVQSPGDVEAVLEVEERLVCFSMEIA